MASVVTPYTASIKPTSKMKQHVEMYTYLIQYRMLLSKTEEPSLIKEYKDKIAKLTEQFLEAMVNDYSCTLTSKKGEVEVLLGQYIKTTKTISQLFLQLLLVRIKYESYREIGNPSLYALMFGKASKEARCIAKFFADFMKTTTLEEHPERLKVLRGYLKGTTNRRVIRLFFHYMERDGATPYMKVLAHLVERTVLGTPLPLCNPYLGIEVDKHKELRQAKTWMSITRPNFRGSKYGDKNPYTPESKIEIRYPKKGNKEDYTAAYRLLIAVGIELNNNHLLEVGDVKRFIELNQDSFIKVYRTSYPFSSKQVSLQLFTKCLQNPKQAKSLLYEE